MAARGTVGSSSGRGGSRTGDVVGRIVPEAVSVIVAVVPSSNSSRCGPMLWKGSSLGPSRLDDVLPTSRETSTFASPVLAFIDRFCCITAHLGAAVAVVLIPGAVPSYHARLS